MGQATHIDHIARQKIPPRYQQGPRVERTIYRRPGCIRGWFIGPSGVVYSNWSPQILSDDQKRTSYDTYGEASTQQGFDPNAFSQGGNPFGAGGFGGFDFSQAFSSGGGNGDLFSQLFGAATGGRVRPSRGQDIEAMVNISFLEGCKGARKTINITPVVECNTCTGSGLKKGATRTKCPTCKGSGNQRFVLTSGFAMESTCPTCHGAGSTVPRSSQCDDCGGIGRVKERRQVEVQIPAGESISILPPFRMFAENIYPS